MDLTAEEIKPKEPGERSHRQLLDVEPDALSS